MPTYASETLRYRTVLANGDPAEQCYRTGVITFFQFLSAQGLLQVCKVDRVKRTYTIANSRTGVDARHALLDPVAGGLPAISVGVPLRSL